MPSGAYGRLRHIEPVFRRGIAEWFEGNGCYDYLYVGGTTDQSFVVSWGNTESAMESNTAKAARGLSKIAI